jgi:hypothetical protein
MGLSLSDGMPTACNYADYSREMPAAKQARWSILPQQQQQFRADVAWMLLAWAIPGAVIQWLGRPS